MNLILAFAVALKHKLRFEPDIAYDDLAGLVGHLDTFALYAHDGNSMTFPPKSPWKSMGEYLSLPFARSNPRKLIKRSKKPLGHLPVEIIMHLSAYIDCCVKNGTLPLAQYQGQACKYRKVRDNTLLAEICSDNVIFVERDFDWNGAST